MSADRYVGAVEASDWCTRHVILCRLLCQIWELFFIKHGAKVNGQYFWDILLRHQLSGAIKRVVDDSLVYQQHSAPGASCI